jgi:predicted ArsR family transcriptional regulator
MKKELPQATILKYITQKRFVTVPELSQLMEISRPAVRYHLEKLIRSKDIIKTDIQSPQAVKGRPKIIYQLSSHEQPNNVQILLEWLLSYIKSSKKAVEIDAFLENFALYICETRNKTTNFSEGMSNLILFLKQHEYFPRWETHKEGPRVIFLSCPYSQVLPRHPELCKLDLLILSHFLSRPVRQISKIDSKTPLTSACKFQLAL